MSLLDRHLGFVEALREAGLSVSLAEGLDAVAALGAVGWDDRETVRTVYAATVVKRHTQRVTFDALFDLWFPRLVGEGAAAEPLEDETGLRDSARQLRDFRERLAARMSDGPPEESPEMATEAMGRFGRMPGRAPGQTGWSPYNTLRRVAPDELVDRLVDALVGQGMAVEEAGEEARARVQSFRTQVEAEALRRLAAERDLGELARTTLRPTIERLEFTSARQADLEELRRALFPLARKLASRLTKEKHSRRRGTLDFRRTVRSSLATGGVPLETHHKPKRPHRSELVVLCDVSGSVANFAQFTLMLVFALREQFTKVRAFTFVDDIHEVTDVFRPGADPGDVFAELASRSAHAARFGRTNYGAAFTRFVEEHADALGPRSTLLILGDARSNYRHLSEDVLADMVARSRRTIWLNPEHRRHWGAGDSAAPVYGEIVPMTECRNLTQLSEFVHDLV
ncbi:vWA domain-containing protein [Nocardioides jishulii]|uniref:VWA domain-containing protein n=1 Tax=Nocardioides jishulii TaxID=2575440 RepID=A0A4U2YVT8_9ACTN|nr:VWA domain-containing protein [Nocardioides jishulii]QCX28852.1 VWA domain-containing protein [Nocardioides jishulii]TKI64251.1 VWA domain-containing protein [Nocardioides jishulii]